MGLAKKATAVVVVGWLAKVTTAVVAVVGAVKAVRKLRRR